MGVSILRNRFNIYNNLYLNKLQELLPYGRYAHWFEKTIASTLPEKLFVCA